MSTINNVTSIKTKIYDKDVILRVAKKIKLIRQIKKYRLKMVKPTLELLACGKLHKFYK